MEEFVARFSAVIIGGIAAIVWLVRLESVSLQNRRENAWMRAQRLEDLAVAKEAREATNVMLSEIRADVRQLIRDGHK